MLNKRASSKEDYINNPNYLYTMKSGYILVIVVFLIILASTIVIFVINNHKADLKSKCCVQCRNGASKDVRGMDISFEPCLYYKQPRLVDGAGNKIEILSAECIDYFKNNPLTVSECR